MHRVLHRLGREAARYRTGLRSSSSWAVGKTFRSNTRKAVAACVNDVQDELMGEKADFCLAQMGHRHEDGASLLCDVVKEKLACSALMACTGEEGAGAGASGATGMSLAAIGLPEGNTCDVFHFPTAAVPQEVSSSVGRASDLMLLGSCNYPIGDLFAHLGWHERTGDQQCGIVGGLQVPLIDSNGVGQGLLYAGGEWHQGGAAVGAMQGKRLKTLVSHGCKPVGEVLEVLQAKARIVEQVVKAGETEPNKNAAVIELYKDLDSDNLLRDGTSVILGMLDEEGADEDDPSSYTLYKVVGVSPETGEMEMESVDWGGEQFTGKKCRFFVQTKQSSEEEYERKLSAFPFEELPQSGAFLFSGHSRQSYEAEHAFTKQHMPGVPIAQVVTASTIVPRAPPYSTSTASVLAWWE